MFRFVLFPFAVLFDMVTTIRNTLYDRGYKPSASFEIPVISVGNLTVGGTGKTPMIEYLIRLLSPPYKIATLSRGYGRKTKGFRTASENENPGTVGDEPFQVFKKFGQKVTVAVGEERALAIPQIIHDFPATDVILLDDAFQHRQVRPSFQIVLSDYERPFYNDFLLPAGRLRESRKGVSRADMVVITKCPAVLKEDKMMEIEEAIRTYTPKPVFFTTVTYGTPIAFEGNDQPVSDKIVLVSGIANSRNLEAYIRRRYNLVKHFDFADHHAYNTGDVRRIADYARKEGAAVITSEKDAVKLDITEFRTVSRGASFFYLPIGIEFLKNGKEFDEMILNVLRRPNDP
jgi:tetraacyldisaccharide 4'-kinase